MFRIDIKQKFLSVRSAFVRLFRFFGFVRMPDRKSPLFRSKREETGKTRTIKEGKRAELYEKIRAESEFSLERALTSPEEIGRTKGGLTQGEAVHALNEHLVYLREVKEERQLKETRIFRRRLLLILGVGAIVVAIDSLPSNPKGRRYRQRRPVRR